MSSGTTYYLRVTVTDEAGNTKVSDVVEHTVYVWEVWSVDSTTEWVLCSNSSAKAYATSYMYYVCNDVRISDNYPIWSRCRSGTTISCQSIQPLNNQITFFVNGSYGGDIHTDGSVQSWIAKNSNSNVPFNYYGMCAVCECRINTIGSCYTISYIYGFYSVLCVEGVYYCSEAYQCSYLYGTSYYYTSNIIYTQGSTQYGNVYSNNSSAYPDGEYAIDGQGNYYWYVRID